MRKSVKNIGILTSSRADYGIYLPLLRKLQKEKNLNLIIIAFGTHLSPFHGMTSRDIVEDGFEISLRINSLLINDDENSIATSCSLTMMKFSDFWSNHKEGFDLIFCLGDRYEMFAAVYAAIPFHLAFAHLHAGETTLGAIDNTYRHAITLASSLHFTSTSIYSEKVKQLTGSDSVYNVGALSLDNLKDLNLLTKEQIQSKHGIDFSIPTILITVHPETVATSLNGEFARECVKAFKELTGKYQLVITMPNADTYGTVFRAQFEKLQLDLPSKVFLVENFGTQGYFSAMKYCNFLIGNTSSGIIEAASFSKYVINLGERQKGREQSGNIYNCDFDSKQILTSVSEIEYRGLYRGKNVYYQGGASERIINIVKDYLMVS